MITASTDKKYRNREFYNYKTYTFDGDTARSFTAVTTKVNELRKMKQQIRVKAVYDSIKRRYSL